MIQSDDLVWGAARALPRLAGTVPPMQQSPAYGAALRAMGSDLPVFLARDGQGRLRGTAQILVRRWPLLGRAALLSRGPVWAPDVAPAEARRALHGLVAQLRADHTAVMATPDRIGGADPLRQTDALEMISPGTLAEIDLRPDPEALRAGLAGKWRNGLVRAERSGLVLRDAPLPPEPDHWLLRAEAAQARARRYARLPPEMILAWIAANGAGSARLFAAYDTHGAPLAGMIFLRHGPGATYQLGWTGAEGRRAGVHALLLWRAMLWARRAGHVALDLGNLDTETAPGLARFKLGAGARPVPLGATWMHAPGTSAVVAVQRGWSKRPGPATA